MDIPTVTRLFFGGLISLYLLFSGWMALNENRVYIPINIQIGLWFASKIYGDEFAQRERDKFLKNQLSQGRQMILIGLIVLIISLLSVFIA